MNSALVMPHSPGIWAVVIIPPGIYQKFPKGLWDFLEIFWFGIFLSDMSLMQMGLKT